MTELILDIKTSLPSDCQVIELAHQIEAEMRGSPLNAQTAFEFTEELKRRVFAMVEIEVSHPTLKG